MDNFDQKIQKIFIDELNPPQKYYNVIKNTIDMIEDREENKKEVIFKFVASFIVTLIMASGMVYAGIKVYEKVWGKPQEITEQDFEVTKEDSAEILDDKILEKRALEELKKLGYETTKIKEYEIFKEPYYNKLYYMGKADCQGIKDELNISIDARSGDFEGFAILDDEAQPRQYRSTIEEAKETAKGILTELNLITDEYEVTNAYGNFMNENVEQSHIYSVTFSKVEGGIINNYKYVHIDFIPVINKITLLIVRNFEFDDNTIEISESEAKEIAENKNSTLFQELEINSIETSLSIEAMNEEIYVQENGLSQTHRLEINNGESIMLGNKYKNDLKIRRVYKVKISYKENDSRYLFTEYFVDTTTGEIIGGTVRHLKDMIQ